jgi:hypothetical protein
MSSRIAVVREANGAILRLGNEHIDGNVKYPFPALKYAEQRHDTACDAISQSDDGIQRFRPASAPCVRYFYAPY